MMLPALIILPLLRLAAQMPDAEQIMGKSRDLTITGSMSAEVRLIITERGGSTRNRTISMTTKSFQDGSEKRFIRFVEPPDVRGTAMLIVDNKNSADEMWVYLPALKKVRRIVTSEKGKSFMSSEFSNADLTSPPLSDFVSRHLEKSGENNQWIIESKPASADLADEYGFSGKVSYINAQSYQIRKIEFYNFDNKIFKTLEIKSIYPLPEGKYLVKDMLADNLITGRKSEILFSDIKVGVNVDDSFFSIQNLER